MGNEGKGMLLRFRFTDDTDTRHEIHDEVEEAVARAEKRSSTFKNL